MTNHSFDERVNQKLGKHEAPVPPGTWEAIAKKNKKRRRYPAFWWIIGIVLLVGPGVFLTLGKHEKQVIAGIKESNNDSNNDTLHNLPVNKKDILNQDEIVADEFKETNSSTLSGNKDLSKNESGVKNNENKNIENKSIISTTPYKGNKNETVNYAITTGKVMPVKTHSEKQEITGRLQVEPGNVKQNEIRTSLKINQHHLLMKNIPILTGETVVLKDEQALQRILELQLREQASTQKMAGKINQEKFSIELSIIPFVPVAGKENLSSKLYTHSAPMLDEEYHADRVNSRFSTGVAYSLALRKRIRPKLQIGIGIQYEIIKEEIDISGTKIITSQTEVKRLENGPGGPILITDTVQTISTSEFSINALNSYRFLSIPVFLNYDLIQRKGLAISLTTGLLFNISPDYNNSITNKLMLTDVMPLVYKKKTAGMDFLAGIRLTKDLKGYKFFLEPSFRHNITRYDQNNLGDQKLIHQARLAAGVVVGL